MINTIFREAKTWHSPNSRRCFWRPQLPNCHERILLSLTCILTWTFKFFRFYMAEKSWKISLSWLRSSQNLLLRWGGQVRCNCWRDARITSTLSNAGPTLITRLSNPIRIFYRQFKFFLGQNPNIFTSFSTKFFLTIFLVKSRLSTAKKSKTTTFSRVFHPKSCLKNCSTFSCHCTRVCLSFKASAPFLSLFLPLLPKPILSKTLILIVI